jgi:hypothetical protein
MELKMHTYLSYLTASAIIASTTTSAMADPKFCTVKNTIRCHVEFLKVELKPKINHGTRESTVAITKYEIRLLPLIGIQSESILFIINQKPDCKEAV